MLSIVSFGLIIFQGFSSYFIVFSNLYVRLHCLIIQVVKIDSLSFLGNCNVLLNWTFIYILTRYHHHNCYYFCLFAFPILDDLGKSQCIFSIFDYWSLLFLFEFICYLLSLPFEYFWFHISFVKLWHLEGVFHVILTGNMQRLIYSVTPSRY